MAPVGQVLGRELFSNTKMCKFHRMGKCTKGTQCPWAHSASEIKVAPDLSRTKLCRELITKGRCTNVDCKYAHSKKECRTADFSQLNPVPASKEASTMHLPDVVPPPFNANVQDFVPMGFTAEIPAFVPMPSPPPGLEDCVPYGPIWGYGRLHREETESESSSNNDIMLNGDSPSAQTSSKGLSRAEFASAGTSASLADL